MSGFTTAFPNSLKAELAQGIHNFSNGGDQFKLALGVQTPSGTYNASTNNYSQMVASSDELPNGSGYLTGGFAWTNAQNITPQYDNISGSAFWQWSANPFWAALTATTSGFLIYNVTKMGRVVYVGSFGGPVAVAGTSLELILPVNGVGSSLIRLGV